jgi:hypothetical protein
VLHKTAARTQNIGPHPSLDARIVGPPVDGLSVLGADSCMNVFSAKKGVELGRYGSTADGTVMPDARRSLI